MFCLFACSTYAPVKSFLRVDKEKVSSLLHPLHYSHLNGNSIDLTPGVPGPVAQVSPSALPGPSVSPSAGMPDLHRGCKEPGNTDEWVQGQAWRNLQKLLRAWPESPGPPNPSCTCPIFSSQVQIYNPAFFKYIHDRWTEHHGRYPSTGMLVLFFALHVCDEVGSPVGG